MIRHVILPFLMAGFMASSLPAFGGKDDHHDEHEHEQAEGNPDHPHWKEAHAGQYETGSGSDKKDSE